MNLHKYLVIAIFVLLVGWVEPTSAQAWTLNPFYVASENRSSRDITIWKVDVTGRSVQPLFVYRDADSPLIRETFPANELAAINSNVQWGAIPADAIAGKAKLDVVEIWTIDATHILIENHVHICYRTSGEYCYGYYEFILFSTSTQAAISLLKVEYRNQPWPECGSGTLSMVSAVLPNPKHNKFAYLLMPQQRCYGAVGPVTKLVIVDYSTQPVTQIQISPAYGIVWSPDGSRIAYFTETANDAWNLTAKVKTYAWASKTTTDIASLPNIPLYFLVRLGWTDDQTLVYQTYHLGINANDDGKDVFVSQNLESGKEVRYSLQQPLTSDIYYLKQKGSVLFSSFGLDQYVAFQSPQSILKTIQPGYQAFYNPRFPDVILLSRLEDRLDHLTALTADLNEMSVDLSALLPKNETVISVSPAGTSIMPATPALK